MIKPITSEIFKQRDHWILFRGWFYLFVLSLPLIGFVGVMGGAAPDSPGFFYSIGVIISMLLGGTLFFLFIFKVTDSCLLRHFAKSTFSYFSILLGAFLFMVYFNIFVDHLFQVKQGNFGISIIGMGGVVGAWALIVVLGNIRLGKPKTDLS